MTPEDERAMRDWMIRTHGAQPTQSAPTQVGGIASAPAPQSPPKSSADEMRDWMMRANGADPSTIQTASTAVNNRYNAAEGVVARKLDPDSPDYVGPGYERVIGPDGLPTLEMSRDPTLLMKHQRWADERTGNGPRTGPSGGTGHAGDAGAVFGGGQGGAGGAAPPPAANLYEAINRAQTGGTGAPQLDTTKVDGILDGLGNVTDTLWELSQDNTGLSAAEAQLKKAQELAAIQSVAATEQSQRSALGTARSSRARGDRAFAERQAIGEAAFIGQEAARIKAAREAEHEGKLAEVRAIEEQHDDEFRFEALKAAGELGLDTAALELDISKVNLENTTNLLNQMFEDMRLEKQLTHDQAVQTLQYMQAMAAIEVQYEQLSAEERMHADRMIMEQYGIDEETRVALAQIKEQGRFRWDQVLSSFAGGVGSGLTGGIAMLLDKDKPAPGPGSDRRAKKKIEIVDPSELEELLEAVNAETWDYKDPGKHGHGRFFGPMAQDLQKAKLGKAMVAPDDEGVLRVDGGRAGLAALSGLSLVYEKLKEIEEAVK